MKFDLPADYEAFKAEVVSDLRDDDQGVWEVWWQANTWYPDKPLSTRLAIAESVVRDLLRDGRIVSVHGAWVSPDHPRPPVTDVDAALRRWDTWVPQSEELTVWIAGP